MGILGDIKAMISVQKIKNGGTTKLSISQITNLIINLGDARKNLPADKCKQVYELYNELRTCNTKMKMDIYGYYETAVDIIKRFDAIAPYEKYSGGNEMEFSFLMGCIRSESDAYNTTTDNFIDNKNDNFVDNEKEEYAKYIFQQLVQQSNSIITLEDVKQFVNILPMYSGYDKNECLDAFDVFADQIIKKYDAMTSILNVSFLLGVLNANKVITQTELDSMRENYNNKFLKIVLPNQYKKDMKDEM